jgi:hypothetical protein
MDKALAAISAVQSLLGDGGNSPYTKQLGNELPGQRSAGTVAGLLSVLNVWGIYLNDRWNRQQELRQFDAAGETALALSRVSSWWIYANQGLIATIDNSTDVAAATAAIDQATQDLKDAERDFDKATGGLTEVAKILDGLFTFIKTVAT